MNTTVNLVMYGIGVTFATLRSYFFPASSGETMFFGLLFFWMMIILLALILNWFEEIDSKKDGGTK